MKIFLLVFSFFLFATGVVFAQETPQKYGIKFPVSELGSCKDLTECRTFCDDPVNKDACISFAKTKGFYKEAEQKAKKAQIIEQAKTELGCDSDLACRALCKVEANRERCSNFAQKVGVTKGPPPSKNPELIEKAKAVLGCDSAESCKNACSEEANREKCTNFAKDTGLKGGTQFKGPGGCTSEETCKSFCSDPANFSLCSSYGQAIGKKFTGIGGCQNETECKSVCEKNPEACKSSVAAPTTTAVGENSQTTTTFSPEDRCNKTPNCSWTDNNCKCNFAPQAAKEYEDVCKKNPESCRKFSTENREEFCKKNPEQCRPQGQPQSNGTPAVNNVSNTNDPAKYCVTRPGCTWSDNACKCGGGEQKQNYEQKSGNVQQYEQKKEEQRPATGEQTKIQTAPAPAADTSTTAPAVQGASIKQSWFSSLLQRLFLN